MVLLTRTLFITLLLLSLTACTQLIFQPSNQHFITPDKIDLAYQDIHFQSADGTQLHGWWLPAKGAAQSTVLYLHGNAQNISNHLGNAYWLPKEGINLFIFDYRGYGHSMGELSLPGAIQDIEAALQQALSLADNTPLVVISHSLGASMGIHALAHSKYKSQLAGAIFAAPFSDYQQIAREVLSKVWLTWPFQYPLSWTINNDFAPYRSVAKLAPLPQLYIHSTQDHIIDWRHSERLYIAAKEPKQLKMLNGGHNQLFNPEKNRQLILQTIRRWSQSTTVK